MDDHVKEQTVTLAEIQNELGGNWTGKNLLRLSWLTPPDHLSDSCLTVAPVAKGKFLSFAYDWSHEDLSQEGLLLLGYDQEEGVVTAAWIDSWHMSSKIMTCTGSMDRPGAIDVRGSYAAPLVLTGAGELSSVFPLVGSFKSRCTTVHLKGPRNWPCKQTMNANHEQLSTKEWRTL